MSITDGEQPAAVDAAGGNASSGVETPAQAAPASDEAAQVAVSSAPADSQDRPAPESSVAREPRAAATEAAGQRTQAEIYVAGVRLIADCAGALYWPEESALIVADLHLEKGSSYAERGVLLPPYDTAATLARLAQLVERYAPRAVIALGDSFHDGGGPARLAPEDRESLFALQRGRDWLWIAGNHDPDPSSQVGGSFAATLAIGSLLFRHAPQAEVAVGEVAGHLHPMARVSGRGRTVRRRCFASDRRRVVLPAFGAYAGGLNVRDRAFADIFGTLTFTAHMLGEARIYAFAATHCLPD